MGLSHEEQHYFQCVAACAAGYLDRLGIAAEPQQDGRFDRKCLEDITAFIQISGAIQGGLLFAVDKRLALLLARKFILDEISDEETERYMVDVVAEIANIITGNALSDRENQDTFFGQPLMIVSDRAQVHTQSVTMQAKPFLTDKGAFVCFFIPSGQMSQLANIMAMNIAQDGEGI